MIASVPPISELIERPHLAVADRLLIAGAAAIADARWPDLVECAATGRGRGIERAEFEEMLLQAVLFFGFPRVVTAFEHFAETWPVAEAPTGGDLPKSRQNAAGLALFKRVYAQNSDAVLGRIHGFHAEFGAFVIEAAYGRILSRPGLSLKRRELLAVGALAAIDQPRQLVAHARGALRAGAHSDEVAEAAFTAVSDAERVAVWMRQVTGTDRRS